MDYLTVAAQYAPISLTVGLLLLLVWAIIVNHRLKGDFKDLHESHTSMTALWLDLSRQPVNRLVTLEDQELLELMASQMSAAIDGSVYYTGMEDPYTTWEAGSHPQLVLTFCDEETLEGFIVTAPLAIQHCEFEARVEVEEPVAEGATA